MAPDASKLHFEDLEVGRTYAYGAYAVTKEEIFEFARAYDPQPHHIDEDAAMKALTRGLCASGWHSCAMFMRLHYDGWLSGYAAMGGNAIDEVKWLKPVRPGDVLKARTTIVDKRVSASRPGLGIAKVKHEILNQNDDLLMTMAMSQFFRVRGALSAAVTA